MKKYFQHYVNNTALSLSYIKKSIYEEVCRFAVHQSCCGETVYIIGYPINYNNIYCVNNWNTFNIKCSHSDILIIDLSEDEIVITNKNIHSYNIIKINSLWITENDNFL